MCPAHLHILNITHHDQKKFALSEFSNSTTWNVFSSCFKLVPVQRNSLRSMCSISNEWCSLSLVFSEEGVPVLRVSVMFWSLNSFMTALWIHCIATQRLIPGVIDKWVLPLWCVCFSRRVKRMQQMIIMARLYEVSVKRLNWSYCRDLVCPAQG